VASINNDSKFERVTVHLAAGNPWWQCGMLTWLALALPLAGCSEAPPFEVAAVQGTVTIDSQPLAQGRIMFAPIASSNSLNAGKAAFGRIQPDGSFVLTTYKDNDGAVVGEHWATIYGPDPELEQVTQVSNLPAGLPKFGRLAVPQKQVVAAGQDNRIDIQLTSQDVARYGKK